MTSASFSITLKINHNKTKRLLNFINTCYHRKYKIWVPVTTDPSYFRKKTRRKKLNKIKITIIKNRVTIICRTALNCKATLKQRKNSKIALSEIEHPR